MVKTKTKNDGKKNSSPEEKAKKQDKSHSGDSAGGNFEAVKPEGKLADGTEIIAVLQPPPAPGGQNIQKMVQEAGWQVAAVDWAFEQVTGNSLVQTVIMPITGDFNKIQQNAEAWNTIADSMKQFSATMAGNAEIVSGDWKGKAAEAHKKYVDTGFKIGLTVEGKVAEVIAKGFQSVADVSQRLCAKALDLLKTLVDKVIDAIAKIWIPAYGWVRAAELIWDAYQLYQKIIEIVDLVKDTVQKVGEMWNSLQKVGSQLGKIKDIGSFADAKQVAKDVAGAAKDVKSNADGIKDNVTAIKDTATGKNDPKHQDPQDTARKDTAPQHTAQHDTPPQHTPPQHTPPPQTPPQPSPPQHTPPQPSPPQHTPPQHTPPPHTPPPHTAHQDKVQPKGHNRSGRISGRL